MFVNKQYLVTDQVLLTHFNCQTYGIVVLYIMATVAKKKKTCDIQVCPYGAKCYRKNPQHLAEFSHSAKSEDSGKDEMDSGASTSKRKLPTVDSSAVPPCTYGAKCYRKNLMHFAEFSHPTTKVAEVDGDSGNDTDVITDEDEKGKGKAKKGVKTSDILKRGMSLVKTYSKMTEDERKELIKKAFEAKKQLQEELDKTKEEVKLKAQQVDKLQAEASKGFLLIDGEKEALEGNETKYFEMFPERAYKEGSADQMHFRLAESQFYRLLSGSTNCRLVKVEYVVNPVLAKKFKQCREDLKKTRGEDCSFPVLAFHGTLEKNIVPICETGFKVPGKDGHKHRTDTGWYGKGVYFSEFPGYCMGYIQGSSKILLCQVLPGKVYHCKTLIHGAALQKGCDSHTSPDKKELVIFNRYHILPAYIVHYKTGAVGEFKYLNQKKTTTKDGKKLTACDNFDEFFDDTELLDKYTKALSKKKSKKTLSGVSVQFTGTFKGTQKQMMDLATQHGAVQGTKSVFTILFASKDEYEMQTSKVLTAIKKDVPIVPEMYLYDSIIAGEQQDIEEYHFP